MMSPIARGRALSAVLLCSCVAALPAATYHVAPGGVDDPARDGLSPATAWASLPYAAARVGSGSAADPHVIRLAAGTYTQTGPADLGSHVSVEGAGTGLSVVNASWPNTTSQFATNTSETRLVRLVGTTANALRDLTLRGNSWRAAGAVWIANASSVTLERVALESFGSSAVVLGPSTSFVTLRDSSISESGFESYDYSLGAIQIYQTEDLLVSNISIRSTLAGTGYGVKAAPSGFGGAAHLRRAVFERLDIRIKER